VTTTETEWRRASLGRVTTDSVSTFLDVTSADMIPLLPESFFFFFGFSFLDTFSNSAVGLVFPSTGLDFRPTGLDFRSSGLDFRPAGLNFRPAGLDFRPMGKKFDLEPRFSSGSYELPPPPPKLAIIPRLFRRFFVDVVSFSTERVGLSSMAVGWFVAIDNDNRRER
jgi:hypothetical protein